MKRLFVTIFFVGIAVAIMIMLIRREVARPQATLVEAPTINSNTPPTTIPASNIPFLPRIVQTNVASTSSDRSGVENVTKSVQASSVVKEALHAPGKHPSPTLIDSLRPDDREALIAAFKNEGVLTNRMAALWLLTAFPEDEVGRLVINTLTKEFAGRRFNQPEWETMKDAVHVLGFVATQSDVAFDFLKRGVSIDFWKTERQWSSNNERLDEYSNRAFGALSVIALAESGRPEVTAILDNLRMEDGPLVRSMAGSIVEGYCISETIQAKGVPYFRDQMLLGHRGDIYHEWVQTPQGRELREWASTKSMKSK